MALFQTMHSEGLFEDVKRVVDLGSQEMHFAERDTISHPHREIIRETILVMGGPELSDEMLASLSNRKSAGEFYKYLGIDYNSLDADGWYNKPFDFNLDEVRQEDRGSYCLSVNHGTTEHLIDQNNAFKCAHDLVRPGGMMIHAVPFMGLIDHGFFNYNPNFFLALARFNSYELLGLWINPFGGMSLIPWDENVMQYLNVPLGAGSGIGITCLLKKVYDTEYCTPFQLGYEEVQDETNLARYKYVIDGKLLSGTDAYRDTQKKKSVENVSGRILVRELSRRIKSRIVSLRSRS